MAAYTLQVVHKQSDATIKIGHAHGLNMPVELKRCSKNGRVKTKRKSVGTSITKPLKDFFKLYFYQHLDFCALRC